MTRNPCVFAERPIVWSNCKTNERGILGRDHEKLFLPTRKTAYRVAPEYAWSGLQEPSFAGPMSAFSHQSG